VFVVFMKKLLINHDSSNNQQIAMCLKKKKRKPHGLIPIRLTALMGIVSSTQMAHLFYVIFDFVIVDANQS